MQEIKRQNSEKIIKKYDKINDDFHITISNESKINFCGIIYNSQISFNFDIISENAGAECYFFVPNKDSQNINLTINTNFKANHTKFIINVIILASDESTITLNGNLHIGSGLEKVESRLDEEALLLGNAKYISMIPGLKVDSPDVIASHGAKIQRISPERLFYMQSRGLTDEKAIGMVVKSYSEMISNKLQLNEKEKSDFYSLLK